MAGRSWLKRSIKFGPDEREDVARRVLAEEDVEVAVPGDDVE